MDETILSEIARQYNLPQAVVKYKVEAGYLSHNWVIESDQKQYFLKQHNSNNYEKLVLVQQAERLFSKNKIPIILPFLNISERSLTAINGIYYSLYPFVNGVVYKRGCFYDKAIVSTAQHLAQMHLVGRNQHGYFAGLGELQLLKTNSFTSYLKLMQGILFPIKNLNQTNALAWKLINLQKEYSKPVKVRSLKFNLTCDHLIHGDFHDSNLFFDLGGNVFAVFDLEEAKLAPREYELVRSIMLICFADNYDQRAFEQAQLYLQAYNEVYPIDKLKLAESLDLMYYKRLFGTWELTEIYQNLNDRPESLLPQTVHHLEYLSQNKAFFKEQILNLF